MASSEALAAPPPTDFASLPDHLCAHVLSYVEPPASLNACLCCTKSLNTHKQDPQLIAQWLLRHRPAQAVQLAASASEAALLHVLHISHCLSPHSASSAPALQHAHLLHLAARAGYAQVAHFLIHVVRVCVDARDENTYTPLHYAAHHGHANVVRVLLSAGADVHATTRNNYAALHFASTNKHDDARSVLLDAGAHITPNFFRERTLN